jgi:hypothetical protein
MNLQDFVGYADRARDQIPRGKVNWSDSPFAWIRHNGPRTKSKLGRDIVQEWFVAKGNEFAISDDGVSHFIVREKRTIVHLGLLSKEGVFEFAQLRAPGKGVDWMLLVGIEPHRARIWQGHTPADIRHRRPRSSSLLFRSRGAAGVAHRGRLLGRKRKRRNGMK